LGVIIIDIQFKIKANIYSLGVIIIKIQSRIFGGKQSRIISRNRLGTQ
jgi:hypothetical protein